MSFLERPLVVIDYAHTPDALAKAIKATRQHTAGRLICVFGCGGNRDAGKRPLMAPWPKNWPTSWCSRTTTASRGPAQIIAAIQSGMQHANQARVERQRAEAIAVALDLAGPGDAVLIAGKDMNRPDHRRRDLAVQRSRSCAAAMRHRGSAHDAHAGLSRAGHRRTAHGQDAAFDGVSIDSRTVPAGALFVALRGPTSMDMPSQPMH